MSRPDPKDRSYYKPGTIEVADFIMDAGLDWAEGNIVKYIVRAGNKPGNTRLEDLQKVANLTQFLINVEKGLPATHEDDENLYHGYAEVVRFTYKDERRIVLNPYVVGGLLKGEERQINRSCLVQGLEVWNSRDGVLDVPQVKSYKYFNCKDWEGGLVLSDGSRLSVRMGENV